MKFTLSLVALAAAISGASAGAIELTKDTWDAETAGKAVFVKFFAPWCGHCKKMKPAWDELADEYKGSTSYLIADVDCTTDLNKPFCAEMGVRGYPSVKYGDPGALEDYKGGRDLKTLKKHVENKMEPVCSLINEGNCSDEQKALLKKFAAMSSDELAAETKKAQDELKKAESENKQAIKKLETDYAAYKKEKGGAIGLMKAAKLSSAKDEL